MTKSRRNHCRPFKLVQMARIPYVMATMSNHLASVLTTVNGPYGEQLDGPTLAYCLSTLDLAKAFPGQVSVFLGEVPIDQQVEFAAAHNIPIDSLKALASDFSAWSGETYPLGA